ncbi:RcnB family protein [Gluconobacter roseus]|nr:RcnB family protein [Gluconobacter roseus]
MKTKLFAGLMAGCLLAAAPLASADPRGGGPGGPGMNGPGGHGDYRGGGRGGGHDRVWRRGDRYDGPRGSRWAINNWRNYRGLYAPPRGYYWMRYGNQFLLTALATGLIAGVVSANGMGVAPGVVQPGVPVAPAPGAVAPGYGPGYGPGPY